MRESDLNTWADKRRTFGIESAAQYALHRSIHEWARAAFRGGNPDTAHAALCIGKQGAEMLLEGTP